MKGKTRAVNFWKIRIEPYLVDSARYKNKLMQKEEKMFADNRNRKYYEQKMEIAKRVVDKIKCIPWIAMIGLTGSVATEWPKEDDDIDFIIICHNNRLWLCRMVLLIRLNFSSFKVRSFFKNEKNSLCFNLWLEENSMKIEKSRRGLLTALEILWMKPMLYRMNFYKNFLIANKWIIKYIKIDTKGKLNRLPKKRNVLLDDLNRALYLLQYMYMKRKIKKEIVSYNKAYFHPRGRMRFDRIS